MLLFMRRAQTSYENSSHIIQIYSGITRGRVPNGEFLYSLILVVNLTSRIYCNLNMHV